MGWVNGFVSDFVDAVQHIEHIALGVNADPFDAGHDFADDFLPRSGVGFIPQCFQVG